MREHYSSQPINQNNDGPFRWFSSESDDPDQTDNRESDNSDSEKGLLDFEIDSRDTYDEVDIPCLFIEEEDTSK